VACSLLATSAFLTGGDFVASDPDRLSEIFFNIAESEYEIRWQDRAGSYQSPNRAQNLRFSYFDDGFVAQRRVQATRADEWTVALRLDRFGKANMSRTLDVGEMTIDRKSAIVAHDGIEMHYHNDIEGMRQNFLVNGSPGEGELRLEVVAVLDGVEMGVSERGDFVYFDNAVEEVLRYSNLNVWDARGEPLAAWFEALDKERFAIVVDDAEATYPVFIDPLSYYWGASGGQGGAMFGFSVAYGAFTPDLGDVAVGAPYYDEGQTDEGKVFVYSGDAAGFPATASWTAQGDEAYGLFGKSVSSGNLNGDDYDDIIVGAPNWDSSLAGAVFVWLGSDSGLGSTGTSRNMDWFKKAGSGSEFGASVAAGNFNNDDFQDLIVGAPSEGNSGKVYVYHGSPSGPNSSANWTATCGKSGAHFGFSVASAGSVNGDAYGDILIGAPDYTNGESGEGAVFIWHGSPSGLSPNPGTSVNCPRRLEGNQQYAQFGRSVAAGNFNGEENEIEYSDVVVGAPLYDNPESNEGMVFVFHGTASGIPGSASNWSMDSDQVGAQFGFSVAVQDLNYNPDGFADLIIGAPYYDTILNVDCGGTFAFYGSACGLEVESDWTYISHQPNSRSGWSVAAGPHLRYVNHPGLIIGVPAVNGSQGAVTVFCYY
jgi:hypothetical protein